MSAFAQNRSIVREETPPLGIDGELRRLAGDSWAAVVDGELQLTWRDLNTLVAQTAMVMVQWGIGAGDIVCRQLPNSWEAIAIHMAAAQIGAVSAPIVPIYRHREVGFILRQTRARVLFVPKVYRNFDHCQMVADLLPGLPELRHIGVVAVASGQMMRSRDLSTPNTP